MNILIDQLPTAVMIDGQPYEINADWRTCVRIILAFEDNELAALEKRGVLLDALYKMRPTNLTAAFEQGMKFLNGGEAGEDSEHAAPRLYSFEKDAKFILAAFQQTHGIDLETTDMHWWKFLALFMDLGPDTTFCNLVGLRKRLKDGKATREERQAAREMASLIDIPDVDDRTPEERDREAEFMRLVEEGEKNRGIPRV